jgi:hypothetical protein
MSGPRKPAVTKQDPRAFEAAKAIARQFLEGAWRHGDLGADRIPTHPHNRFAMALIKNDQRMPEYLRKHVCALLEKDMAPRGRGKPSFRRRDQCLRVAVFLVTRHGFAPTRNALTSRNKQSGCSIVASVLKEIGVRSLSERSIVRIYQKAPVRN